MFPPLWGDRCFNKPPDILSCSPTQGKSTMIVSTCGHPEGEPYLYLIEVMTLLCV